MPSSGTITYPISFNDQCTVLLTDNASNAYALGINEITKSKAKGHPSDANLIETIMIGF